MKKPSKKAIIIGVIIFATISVWYLFLYSPHRLFNRTIVYVTEGSVYHEYFRRSEYELVSLRRGFAPHNPIRYASNGKAVVNNTDMWSRCFVYVIDMETGRELMRFQTMRNWRSYERAYSIVLPGDGTVMVRRHLRNRTFPMRSRVEVGLLDIETGRVLIPFESRNMRIRHVSNGLAIVGDPEKIEGYYGVMDIEKGEIILPMIYSGIEFIYGNLVRVSKEVGEEYNRDDRRFGIIDGFTGEVIRPIIYQSIRTGVDDNNNLVLFRCGDTSTLIDLTTGEEMIDLTQFEFWRVSEFGYGLIVISGDLHQNFRSAVIEVYSSREIISMDRFRYIQILNENTIIGRNRTSCGDRDDRIFNVHTGEEIFPRENYNLRNIVLHSAHYSNGLLLIENDDGQAVIDTATGEKIVPFGTYEMIHRMFSGGFITVSVGDYWKIVSLQSYLQ